jgi:hypothetical protein
MLHVKAKGWDKFLRDAYITVLKNFDPTTPVATPNDIEEVRALLEGMLASQDFGEGMNLHDFGAYAKFASGNHPANKTPPPLTPVGHYARRWIAADCTLSTKAIGGNKGSIRASHKGPVPRKTPLWGSSPT